MKKTVSFLLALIMICCMAVPAFAAENETLVTLTIDESVESYEVTIPPTITLEAAAFATDGGGKTALNVTINKLSAVWSTEFRIYVTSQNGCYLVNAEDSSKMISYVLVMATGVQMSGSGNNTTSKRDSYFFGSISDITDQELPYNTTSSYPDGWLISGYLCRNGNDAYPGGGTYTDTLTFTFKFSK